MTRQGALRRSLRCGLWPVPLVGSAVSDPIQELFDTRRGFGKRASAGVGVGVNILTVTTTDDNGSNASPTPGSLRAMAKAAIGPTNTLIRFAPGLAGDIAPVNKQQITIPSNTMLTGHGYYGTVRCRLTCYNQQNVVMAYITACNPFLYSLNVSGGAFETSNARDVYLYKVSAWDTGDVCIAAGRFYTNANDLPGASTVTIDKCRIGPNPGPYAMMCTGIGGQVTNFTDYGEWTQQAYPAKSTVTHNGVRWWSPLANASAPFETQLWGAPGYHNGFENDARNGKGVNSSFDHNYVYGGSKGLTVEFTSPTDFAFVSGTSLNTAVAKNLTYLVAPGVTVGSDGQGSPWTQVDATHGTLSGGATYSGNIGDPVTGYVYPSTGVPHIDLLPYYRRAAFMTVVECVFQGVHVRGPKAQEQYGDFVGNLMAKYGTPYDLGGPAIRHGTAAETFDNTVMNIEGGVWIPPNNGEEILGWRHTDADNAGVANHVLMREAEANYSLAVDYLSPRETPANVRIPSANNWRPGLISETPGGSAGFDRTAEQFTTTPGMVPTYDLTVPDVSTYTKALAHVRKLEDAPLTRAGNPHGTPLRSWRDVHTKPGSNYAFPAG